MIPFEKVIVATMNAALRGKKVIIRRRGGKIILAQSPTIDKNRLPTDAQKVQMDRLKAATAYANAAMKNPELSKLYNERRRKNQSVFNCAVKDFMGPPRIIWIDASGYNGTFGSTLLIKAIDNFEIKKVEVSIFDGEGNLVEEGNARLDPILRLRWIYIATKEIANLHGYKIKAVAQDLPGNTGELEITL